MKDKCSLVVLHYNYLQLCTGKLNETCPRLGLTRENMNQNLWYRARINF
jgi:hypothetical protein